MKEGDSGYASLYTHKGYVLTSPEKSNIGKNIQEVSSNAFVQSFQDAIHNEEGQSLTENGQYSLTLPIQITFDRIIEMINQTEQKVNEIAAASEQSLAQLAESLNDSVATFKVR
jgi:methyl-accepting chemotaxis protein